MKRSDISYRQTGERSICHNFKKHITNFIIIILKVKYRPWWICTKKEKEKNEIRTLRYSIRKAHVGQAI